MLIKNKGGIEMKHETYLSFWRKMNSIWKECKVDVKVAEKDGTGRYTVYKMKTPSISRMKVAYDNEKLKNHIGTFRNICEMVPQVRVNTALYVIPVGQLNDDEKLNEITDLQERQKMAHQCASLSELFLSMCETCDIMYGIIQESDEPSTIYGAMREEIYSFYRE